jgi:hypothetical protein
VSGSGAPKKIVKGDERVDEHVITSHSSLLGSGYSDKLSRLSGVEGIHTRTSSEVDDVNSVILVMRMICQRNDNCRRGKGVYERGRSRICMLHSG